MSLQSTLRRTGDGTTQARIQQAVDDLDTMVREIRTAIFDLHTAAEAAAGSGIAPTVRISGAVDTLVPREVGAHAVAATPSGTADRRRWC